MKVEAFAPAKINLTLHVTGQRADGYHLLDSLVVFAAIGDRLTLSAAEQLSLAVTGPERRGVPNDHRNLVWKALAAAGVSADVTLEKNLPNAAGIGGGSSDAAAALRAAAHLKHSTLSLGGLAPNISPAQQALLRRAVPPPRGGAIAPPLGTALSEQLWDDSGLKLDASKGPQAWPDASQLGADVPVCLNPIPQRMQGIGEKLSPISNLPPLWLVLVNPRVPVATPLVFQNLTERHNAPMPSDLPTWQEAKTLATWLGQMRNDLQAPAIQSVPIIGTVLDALSGALIARMSGSGATCFGLFESAAAAAKTASSIRKAEPEWWVADAPVITPATVAQFS